MRTRVSSLITFWYRLSHPVYALFWRWFQPTTVGVKVIVSRPDGAILLVKTRYQEFLVLPGGGVHRGETPERAALREVREECGLRISPGDLVFTGLLSNFSEGKSDYIAIFTATVPENTSPSSGIEIAEVGWFTQDRLPVNVSPATRRRLAEWRDGEMMTGMW